MWLGRVAIGVGLVLAGTAAFLQTIDMLATTLHWLQRWWPTFLIAVGLLLLVRSARPPAAAVAALVLVATGALALATIRGDLGPRAWTVVAAVGMFAGGLAVTISGLRRRKTVEMSSTPSILVAFRTKTVRLRSRSFTHARVVVIGGRLNLDLTRAAPAKVGTALVDITVCFGSIDVVPLGKVGVWFHPAFVVRRGRPLVGQRLEMTEEQVLSAGLIISAINVFGEVTVNSSHPPKGPLASLDAPSELAHPSSSASH